MNVEGKRRLMIQTAINNEILKSSSRCIFFPYSLEHLAVALENKKNKRGKGGKTDVGSGRQKNSREKYKIMLEIRNTLSLLKENYIRTLFP